MPSGHAAQHHASPTCCTLATAAPPGNKLQGNKLQGNQLYAHQLCFCLEFTGLLARVYRAAGADAPPLLLSLLQSSGDSGVLDFQYW